MYVRIATLSAVALFTLGCISLHADVPAEAVRHHLAQENGIDLAAICSYAGETFSEGAVTCMASRRMSCSPDGRWVQDGHCS